jgi:hypothetical protein
MNGGVEGKLSEDGDIVAMCVGCGGVGEGEALVAEAGKALTLLRTDRALPRKLRGLQLLACTRVRTQARRESS